MGLLNKLLTVPVGRRRGVVLATLATVSVAAGAGAGMLAFGPDGEESGHEKSALATVTTADPPPSASLPPTSTLRAATRTHTEQPTPQPRAKTTTVVATPKATASPKPAKSKSKAVAPPDISGQFLIRNHGTGFCVDLPLFGVPAQQDVVTQWECTSGAGDNQEFVAGQQSGSEFLLKNQMSGLCLNADGAGAVPAGDEISLWECIGGTADNMVFRAKSVPGGWQLKNLKTVFCLDISTANGDADQPDQRLALTKCSSAANQVWTFDH